LVVSIVKAVVSVQQGMDQSSSENVANYSEDGKSVKRVEGWWNGGLEDRVRDGCALGNGLVIEILQGSETNGGALHVVHGVVALVDGLTKQEEIVGVRHEQHGTEGAVTVEIVDVVLGLNLKVKFREHHLEGLELVSLSTVNKNHTLINLVLGVTSSGDDLINDRFKEQRGNHKMGRTGIEDAVRSTINCKLFISIELDRLDVCGPEEVIVEAKYDGGFITDHTISDSVLVRLTEVAEARFLIVSSHTEGEGGSGNFILNEQLFSEKWSNFNLVLREDHLLVLTHSEDTFDGVVNTSLGNKRKVFELIDTTVA